MHNAAGGCICPVALIYTAAGSHASGPYRQHAEPTDCAGPCGGRLTFSEVCCGGEKHLLCASSPASCARRWLAEALLCNACLKWSVQSNVKGSAQPLPPSARRWPAKPPQCHARHSHGRIWCGQPPGKSPQQLCCGQPGAQRSAGSCYPTRGLRGWRWQQQRPEQIPDGGPAVPRAQRGGGRSCR